MQVPVSFGGRRVGSRNGSLGVPVCVGLLSVGVAGVVGGCFVRDSVLVVRDSVLAFDFDCRCCVLSTPEKFGVGLGGLV